MSLALLHHSQEKLVRCDSYGNILNELNKVMDHRMLSSTLRNKRRSESLVSLVARVSIRILSHKYHDRRIVSFDLVLKIFEPIIASNWRPESLYHHLTMMIHNNRMHCVRHHTVTKSIYGRKFLVEENKAFQNLWIDTRIMRPETHGNLSYRHFEWYGCSFDLPVIQYF